MHLLRSGARKPNSQQDWDVSDFFWTSDGSPLEYHKFPPILPDNQGGVEDKCVMLGKGGLEILLWMTSGSWDDIESATKVPSPPLF